MKYIYLSLIFFGLQIILPASSARDQNQMDTQTRNLTIYGIRGSSGLGMIRLFEEPPIIPGFNIRVEALAQADLLAARFISGDAKIGILPPNIAAKIASAGTNIKTAAVVGMGMLSLLTSDPDVNTIADLRGKTVEAAGQGATPDYVFRRILLEQRLNPDTDVRLGFSLSPPEIAMSIIAGRISTALLPEPFASIARAGRPDLRSVADIRNEWQRAAGTENYPMTVLAMDGDFAAQNPAAVEIVLSSFEESINWTIANPVQAAMLAEKHELGFPTAAASAAVPLSNYVFIRAPDARPSLESLFRVFLDFSPESIGGRLPEDSFYLY